MAGIHLDKVRELFEQYDIDKDDSLSINEVATLLAELGNKITNLPAVCVHCFKPLSSFSDGKLVTDNLPMNLYHLDRTSSLSTRQIPRP